MDNAKAKVISKCGQADYDQFSKDLAAACTLATQTSKPLACSY
jgi:hypothetical protein